MDKLITTQPVLQQHWLQYHSFLNTIKLDPGKYDCEMHDIVQLENICNDIEFTLLSGKIFEVCIIKYIYVWNICLDCVLAKNIFFTFIKQNLFKTFMP